MITEPSSASLFAFPTRGTPAGTTSHKENLRGDCVPCLQERRSGQIFHLMVPSRGLPQAQERPPARGRRSLLDKPRANPGSGAPGLPQQRSIDIERREMKRSFVYRST